MSARAARRLLLLPLALVLASACRPGSETQESETETRVRAEASAFLDALRAETWEEAVPFVSLDDVTRSRMGIPSGASDEVIRSKVQAWLRTVYGSVKPGPVQSVRIDPADPDLARVTYRHDDLDGFHMRFVGSRWLYTLDWKPRTTERQNLPR